MNYGRLVEGGADMRLRWLVILGALGLPVAGGASASVFSDDLARCLVAETTSEDRTNIVRMMFYAAAANPAFSGLTNISDAQRRDGLRTAAAVYDRLVLVDCRAESIAAIRNDGAASVELAFQNPGSARRARIDEHQGGDGRPEPAHRLHGARSLRRHAAGGRHHASGTTGELSRRGRRVDG
jgi:hypothetical protein